ALATSLSAAFNFGTLWITMQKKYRRFHFKAQEWFRKFASQVTLFSAFCVLLFQVFQRYDNQSRLASFVLLIFLVSFFYFLLGFFFRLHEHQLFIDLWQEFQRKLKKSRGGR
ncbi:MAG: hypothetical protein ACUVQZ_01540, partial [Candidatus Caldatribacteriaceae bacterium]